MQLGTPAWYAPSPMRLREVRAILTRHTAFLLAYNFAPATQDALRLPNLTRLRTALEELRHIETFYPAASGILANNIFATADDERVVPAGPGHQFVQQLQALASRLRDVLSVLDQDRWLAGDMVYVKLPDTKSLTDFQGYVHALTLVFDQPARRALGEGVDLAGVEPGSVWIALSIAVGGVWAFIKDILTYSQQYRERELRLAKQEEDLRHLIDDNKGVEHAKSILRKALTVVVQQFAEELARKHKRDNEDVDNEAVSFNLQAITTLSGLLAKGAEVHPALTAETAEKTPPVTLLQDSTGEPKLLTATTGDASPPRAS